MRKLVGNNPIIVNAPFGAGGTAAVPGSKSISNRVLLLAAMAEGQTILRNPLTSDDTRVMVQALADLGVEMEVSADSVRVKGTAGIFPNKTADLFLGNAGTAVRSLVSVLCFSGGEYVVRGVERMHERPIEDLLIALRSIGSEIECLEQEGFLPLKIGSANAYSLDDPIKIRGETSSQFLSGLLMALPLLRRRVQLRVIGDLVSKPYVALTLKLMREFGVNVTQKNWSNFEIDGDQCYKSPQVFTVEGDASSASYFFAAGFLDGGPVTVDNIFPGSQQGDIGFLTILEDLGAQVTFTDSSVTVARPMGGLVPAFDLDLNHIPDAAMTLAVVALFANGTCRLRNIENWRVKETDRLAAMATELRKFGAIVVEGQSDLTISPPERISDDVSVDTYEDHRIAMCFSLVSLSGATVKINDPECVNKTFPNYFREFEGLTKAPVISIDGPSGAGKGTVAKLVANSLGFHYLDSGALYRAVALYYLEEGRALDLDDEKVVSVFMQKADIKIVGESIFMGAEDVTRAIRDESVSMAASKVASNSIIREKLYGLQRSLRHPPGLVADGRDMSTTVFPESSLKIFLTATVERRAERRYAQLVKDNTHVKMEGLILEMKKRDEDDMNRSHSPLRRADSAIEIDNTDMSIEEVVSMVIGLYRKTASGE